MHICFKVCLLVQSHKETKRIILDRKIFQRYFQICQHGLYFSPTCLKDSKPENHYFSVYFFLQTSCWGKVWEGWERFKRKINVTTMCEANTEFQGPGKMHSILPLSLTLRQLASPLRTHFLHFLKEAIRSYWLWHFTFLCEMSSLIEADDDYNQASLKHKLLFMSETRKPNN